MLRVMALDQPLDENLNNVCLVSSFVKVVQDEFEFLLLDQFFQPNYF